MMYVQDVTETAPVMTGQINWIWWQYLLELSAHQHEVCSSFFSIHSLFLLISGKIIIDDHSQKAIQYFFSRLLKDVIALGWTQTQATTTTTIIITTTGMVIHHHLHHQHQQEEDLTIITTTMEALAAVLQPGEETTTITTTMEVQAAAVQLEMETTTTTTMEKNEKNWIFDFEFQFILSSMYNFAAFMLFQLI